MIVVSDTSPLIALAQLNLPDLLPELFEQVIVPLEVWREFAAFHKSSARVKMLSSAWLLRQEADASHEFRARFPTLDDGEIEVLALADQTVADLVLLDELAGRTAAQSLGFAVLGTARLLVIGKKRGLIQEVRPLLRLLTTTHRFRLGDSIMKEILREAGELSEE